MTNLLIDYYFKFILFNDNIIVHINLDIISFRYIINFTPIVETKLLHALLAQRGIRFSVYNII